MSELTEQQKIAEEYITEQIEKGRVQKALGATEICAQLHLLDKKQLRRIFSKEVGPKEEE